MMISKWNPTNQVSRTPCTKAPQTTNLQTPTNPARRPPRPHVLVKAMYPLEPLWPQCTLCVSVKMVLYRVLVLEELR